MGSWYSRDEISASIDELLPRLREVRHDIHKHPELGFEEHRTQKLVRNWLEQHGYETQTAAETGVFADLRPDLHARGTTIGLRADLDCLPMDETTELPYRSVHPGRAHKCGHDGHTTILMGVAAVLARHRDAVDGNVRLIFQPAEEGVRGGGARVMVAEGVLDRVDEVYALHNWPAYPHGEIRVRSGPLMAQTHELDIEVTGIGGHGSQPQICRDPILAASHLVTALQSVVARGLGYEGGAVVSICRFQAGSADNIIPERAQLGGTIRTFSPDVTDRVLRRLREIVKGTADTFGVQIRLDARAGYPVLINDEGCVDAVNRVAAKIVGESRVSGNGLPMAGGEDFAYMAQATRGAYFFIGAGEEGRPNPVCHHPDFDFDDRIIPTGMSMMLGLVDDRLG